MSNACERCKQWDELFYWNHTSDEDKHFFKVIMGDSRHGMAMPAKFARNFRGAIAETITLEARNGSACDVRVAKNSGKVVLGGHGWEAFAGAHDLRSTDFVVFRYCGDSRFKVIVFDASGCEKPSSCVSVNDVSVVNKAEASPVVLPTRSSSSGHGRRPSPAPAPQKKRRVQPRRECAVSRGNKIVGVAPPSGRHSDAAGRDASSSSSEEDRGEVQEEGAPWCQVYVFGGGGGGAARLSGCVFPLGTRLTRAQKAAVEEKVRAGAGGAGLPLLGAVMTESRVNCQTAVLSICREYAKKWLPSEDQSVRLRRHGRSWDLWLQTTKRNTRVLCGGWWRFVKDNGVRAGDVCLFERLNNTKMCAMDVHIIRTP